MINSQGMNMKAGPEVVAGTQFVPLKELSDRDIDAIQHLAFNALNADEREPTREQLGDDMLNPREAYLKEGAHGAVFVAKEGERIIGFLALEKEINGPGRITQLRFADVHHEEALIAGLLHAAEEHLREAHCTTLVLETENPWHELVRYCEHNKFDASSQVESDTDDGKKKTRFQKALYVE